MEKVEEYIKHKDKIGTNLGRFLCKEFQICDSHLADMKDTEVMKHLFGEGNHPRTFFVKVETLNKCSNF